MGFAIYDSSWYNMQPDEAKVSVLILLRAKRPFEITAGKFFVFSLDTFSSVRIYYIDIYNFTCLIKSL